MSLLKTKVNKLLLKFKNGNNYALKELFDLLYKKLKIVAYQYLKNKNDADDVVSLTFIQINASISQFDITKDGYNWICKIAERKALDLNRKFFETELASENLIEEKNIFDEIDNKQDIYEMIKKLDKEEQELIYLYFFSGYTYKEIGDKKGFSPQMAHKKIKRIIQQLGQRTKI